MMERIRLKLRSKLLFIIFPSLFMACSQNEKKSNDVFARNILDAFIETFELNPDKGSISVSLSIWTDSSTHIDLGYIENKYESEGIDEYISNYRSFKISKNINPDFQFLDDLKWKFHKAETRKENYIPAPYDYDNVQISVLRKTKCILNIGEGTTDSLHRSKIIMEFNKRNLLCK